MNVLDKALSSKYVVISVMGPHAGETVEGIYKRKIEDIKRIQKTFWLINSYKAKTEAIQKLCKLNEGYMIFIDPSSRGGARPATEEKASKLYTKDRKQWIEMPEGLSPVTGKITKQSTAVIFDYLSTDVNGVIDLWQYADFNNEEEPLKFRLGCSSFCSVKRDMKNHPNRMKSRLRNINAVAKIVDPFAVWLKQNSINDMVV